MKSLLSASIFILLAAFTLPAAGASPGTQAPDPRPTNTLLYAQVGSRATLKPIENQPHWYRLTIHDINDNTLWFTSHPFRQTGSISIQRFVSRWQEQQTDQFAKKHVNATLVSFFIMDGRREQHSMLLRLTRPDYDAEKKDLSYDVRFSPRENPQLIAEQPFYDAALFIDNLSLTS